MKLPVFRRLRARRQSRGVAIITAIFLLVVVAGLAVAVVSLSTSQQSSSALDVQAARAYQAARAGIEWAVYTGTQGTAANPAAAFGCTAANLAVTQSLALPANTTLSSFTVTVTVTCDGNVNGIAAGGAKDPTAGHIQIQSVACNQPAAGVCPNAAPGPDYVARTLRAQL